MKLTAPKASGIGPARLERMKIAPTAFKTTVIDSSEAAYYLRERLGPLRAWADFLTDLRRGRAAYLGGHELVPCCRIRRRGWSPAYALEDVDEFIAGVLKDEPGAGPAKLETMTVTIAPAAGWHSPMNSFNNDGTTYVAPPAVDREQP
jgi:hypothetical protein